MNYAESKGESPINWWERLDQLEELAMIPEDDWTDEHRQVIRQANMAAQSWTTCPVGNQCSIIERKPLLPRGGGGGKPTDQILSLSGTHFMDAIETFRISDARDILKYIEDYAVEYIPDEIERVIGALDADAQKSLVRLMREHLVPREIDDLVNNGCVALGGEITDGGRLVAMELIKRGLVSLD